MPALNELSAIPFGSLIGGPLIAAVEAQAKAAMTTVDFINAVGFDEDQTGKKVRNVTFSYVTGRDRNNQDIQSTLDVPLLSIVPIPFLRIENMDIHFKASISQSMETKESEATTTAGEVKTTAGGGFLGWKAEMSASVSSKKDSSSTRDSRYSVEYTMDINVHAVQDDIPAGLAKVLGLLNESMDRQLQASPSPTPQPGPQEKPKPDKK
jgi:hypothetical protein